MGGMPALADTTEAVANSTGLTEGQPLGRSVYFKPTFGDDILAVRTLVNGAYPYFTTADRARDTGVMANFTGVADDTDAEVTVEFYTAPNVHTDLTTKVHTDFVAPTATFTPVGGLVHDTTTITATPQSDDVAAVVLSRAGTEISRATAAPWQLTWDTAGSPVTSVVTLQVIDRGGNITTTYGHFTVDNAGPSVDVDRITWHGRHTLDARFSDPSGVDRVEWWVDGVLASSAETLNYDFGESSDTLDVVIKAWDRNGHGSVTPFQLRVDADAPTLVSNTPANGTLVRGTSVNASVVLADEVGVWNVIPIHGLTGLDQEAPFTGKFKLGKDGRQILKWFVEDGFSNQTIVYQNVIVDNTKPTLTVSSGPKNGAKVKGTVKIGAKAADKNGIAKVQLLVNGKVVATDTKAGYAFSINTAKYGKTIKIAIRAYDRAGNVVAVPTRVWHR
ncbi:hypothetical protein L3i22_003090 [Actinoplanes sp. L3-i22]|nr:hypothetical protein L3i22_003090 [Actinoplanes sp. L3-i22]